MIPKNLKTINKFSIEQSRQKKFREAAQKNKNKDDYQISLWKKEGLETYLKYFFIYFQPHIKEDNSKTLLLDIGCGPGTFSKKIAQKGFVVYAADCIPEIIEIAKNRTSDVKINYLVSDIYNIPFPEEYFDIIICLGVLQNIDDTEKAIGELRNKLKKNGVLIITTLNRFSIYTALNHFLRKNIEQNRFNPFVFKNFMIKMRFKSVNLKGLYVFPKQISLVTKIIINLKIYKLLNLLFPASNILSHNFYLEAKK